MPELPEVKTVVKHLNNHIINQTIIDVIINKPKLIKEIDGKKFKEMVINKKIKNIENYGKFIVFGFNDDLIMLSHLRMEGKYRIENSFNNIQTHDYIIFKLANKNYLIYNDSRQFGTFHLRNKDNYKKTNPLVKVAPEPHQIYIDDVYKKIQKKRISIKSALLDQTIMAGLGNIYVNEVLWKVKINPEKKTQLITLDELTHIINTSICILDQATALGGTTIKSFISFDKNVGQYQQFLQVHNKFNQPCARCQTLISKKSVGGRGTYYCPKCQF